MMMATLRPLIEAFESCSPDVLVACDYEDYDLGLGQKVIFNDNGEVKMLIEFDGKQHQGEGVFAKTEEEALLLYNELTYSDNLKNEYCFNKCIPLLRIPYDKYAYIDEILTRVLK